MLHTVLFTFYCNFKDHALNSAFTATMPLTYLSQGIGLLSDPKATRYLVPLLLLAEAALGGLILFKVPYTEIDWSTYMVHVQKFLSGERVYPKITGPTGPAVYPAIYLYIYSALYWVTDKGKDIAKGQIIFAVLYLVTLAIVMQCYRRVNAPPWLLVPLVLSKRLHSIFMLRMFNDCWATFFLWTSIYLLQRRQWEAGAFVWGVGLGVKMILLLAAPALAFVLIQGAGFFVAIFGGAAVVMLQVITAIPFLDPKEGDASAYFHQAFDFGRQFLYEWTVNWRFVAEETFLSKSFAIGLLVLHISILAVFVQTRWQSPAGSPGLPAFLRKFVVREKGIADDDVAAKVTPTFVMDTMLASMAIGLLCARSLHYQFYAYLGWATPYLLWRSGGGFVWVFSNWAAQEYAWLIFPSSDLSSMIVVFELALQVLSGLIAPPVNHIRPPTHLQRKNGPKKG